jgi:cation diffusion facilitator family transporter
LTSEASHHEKRSLFAVNLGLGTNIVLAGLKTAVGILGHSPALLADGINSTSDVAYYLVVRVFMGLAQEPADDEHPYGHRQLESIAAVVVGAFVLTTGIAIFWDAINKVYDLWTSGGRAESASIGALGVAILTIAVKIALTSITRRIGRQADNPAVLALAQDHRNDIFAASAAFIGILLARMGYVWVDPLAGAVVAAIILHTGLSILRQSSGDLMDTVPGKALYDRIHHILEDMSGNMKIEEVLSHRFGPYLVINITIGVDGALSVADGDEIATRVENTITREIAMVKRVHVHYHPVRARHA